MRFIKLLMNSLNYISRVSDKRLKILLESTGASLVEGAKYCGKTQSSLQIANSVVDFQDPERVCVLLQYLARNISTLATAAMRTNANGILRDFENFGFLFESLCTRGRAFFRTF